MRCTGQSQSFEIAVDDLTKLPWEMVHLAQIALEVRHPLTSGLQFILTIAHTCSTGLLLTRSRDRTQDVRVAQSEAHRSCWFFCFVYLYDYLKDFLLTWAWNQQVARTKRLRALRTTARESVRELGARVSAYGKRIAKQRPATIASLASLRSYPDVRPMIAFPSCGAQSAS